MILNKLFGYMHNIMLEYHHVRNNLINSFSLLTYANKHNSFM